MKKLFWIAILLVISLVSCEEYHKNELPASGGSVDELLVVLNDDLVKTEFSDTLVYFFMQPYPGLPQYEPYIRLRIKKYSQFKGARDLLANYRNIMFCSPLNEKGPVTSLIKDTLGSELDRALADTGFYFVSRKNVYARPQQVLYCFGPDREDIIHRLMYQGDVLFEKVRNFETSHVASAIFSHGERRQEQRTIQEKWGLHIRIPADYLPITEKQGFYWFRKESYFNDKKGNILKEVKQNLLISFLPETENDTSGVVLARPDSVGPPLLAPGIIILRDSIAARHVHGAAPEYVMYTDILRPVFQKKVKINGKLWLETRGLWRLDNPFMGGPFVNYSYQDSINKRVIMIDIFLYAAGLEKHKYLRELEAICSTLSL